MTPNLERVRYRIRPTRLVECACTGISDGFVVSGQGSRAAQIVRARATGNTPDSKPACCVRSAALNECTGSKKTDDFIIGGNGSRITQVICAYTAEISQVYARSSICSTAMSECSRT